MRARNVVYLLLLVGGTEGWAACPKRLIARLAPGAIAVSILAAAAVESTHQEDLRQKEAVHELVLALHVGSANATALADDLARWGEPRRKELVNQALQATLANRPPYLYDGGAYSVILRTLNEKERFEFYCSALADTETSSTAVSFLIRELHVIFRDVSEGKDKRDFGAFRRSVLREAVHRLIKKGYTEGFLYDLGNLIQITQSYQFDDKPLVLDEADIARVYELSTNIPLNLRHSHMDSLTLLTPAEDARWQSYWVDTVSGLIEDSKKYKEHLQLMEYRLVNRIKLSGERVSEPVQALLTQIQEEKKRR